MDLAEENRLLKGLYGALEKMYHEDVAELVAERDRLRRQLEDARGDASAMAEKADVSARQLRHV